MNDWDGFEREDDARREQERKALIVGLCVAAALVTLILVLA